jgi:sterol desaturase/sphingolipid hydroxylase (fatty acid hydroxylase superfamily)
MDDTSAPPRHPWLARAVAAIGHPLIVGGALSLWWTLGADDSATLVTLATTVLVSMMLEQLVPAVPAWRLGPAATLRLAGLYLLTLIVSSVLIVGYGAVLPEALAGFRSSIGTAVWPTGWPVLAQALLLYFASDFIYYWIHRAIHRWPLLWRVSGHGFHHGFQNLHALNAGTNHPFELVTIALPLVLLAALFGAPGEAVAAAGVLLLSNSALAHANVRMHTPLFSFFFTASDHHRRHHSVVFEESNTNYACNAILWDRLFGTYSRGPVLQTGIGPSQPALWRMFLLPFREPVGADTVVTRARAMH